MEIGILHLTDLHFNSKNNIITDRIENIHSAIKLDFRKVSKIYIVISGDIVNKGSQNGYEAAKRDIKEIQYKMHQVLSGSMPKLIIVPGNHDCNFDYDNQLRKNTIGSIGYETIGENDNSVFDLCTTVQKDFWGFYNNFNKTPENKLFYQIVDNIGTHKICFNCINTSWMSKQNDDNNLFFPVKRFDNPKNIEKGVLNISVFHHPVSWFTPNGEQNNRKEFQRFIEENSSLILYGHEHVEGHRKETEFLIEKETLYFSGKVLQNHSNSKDSGFQTIKINVENKTGEINNYLWDSDLFRLDFSKTFKLNGEIYGHKRFKHNLEYIKRINDVRIPLSLDNNSSIKLSDFYVFPDLESTEIKKNSIDGFYDSEKLIKENNFFTCIIEGENQAGKTSLISMLYYQFVDMDQYPLFIDSKTINNPNIDKALKTAFSQQYNGTELDFERYTQYDNSKKIILIDNLQDLKFNIKTINSIISDLEARFSKVIIVTSTLYGLLSQIESEFDKLKIFAIKPLGYKKRNQLIENYHRLELSRITGTDEQLLALTKSSFNQVETVLGDELMPSYPVFVLSILQSFVYARPANHDETSYSYCYQALIHVALEKKANVENNNIDSFFNFLSEFSFYLYVNDKTSFNIPELELFYHSYKEKFVFEPTFSILQKTLLQSRLIIKDENNFEFSYKYIFYFLVARKIAEIINKEEGKSIIKSLCKNLHIEKNANILIFVSHHTKDDFLIAEATFTAMLPFENIEPITLEKRGHYFDMIKDIVRVISSDILEETSNPVESRNEIMESRDKQKRDAFENKFNKAEECDDITEFMLPFYQAFRAIEIVGQIIKNRKGSIPIEQLVDMIVELYYTAFRTISFFGKSLLEIKDSFIETLLNKIDQDDTTASIKEKTSIFFQFISLQMCLGVFGKVIYSVGQKDLRELYVEAAKK
ncbi:MAG: metallophosphoesterase [Bacteroidetes bacterium]|nr:metallophosphoesterase [Bacteroidota bacterium]